MTLAFLYPGTFLWKIGYNGIRFQVIFQPNGQIPMSDHQTTLLRLVQQSLESWSLAGVDDCVPIPPITARPPRASSPTSATQQSPSQPMPRSPSVRPNSQPLNTPVPSIRSAVADQAAINQANLYHYAPNSEGTPLEMVNKKSTNADSMPATSLLPYKHPPRKVATSLPDPSAVGVEWTRVLPSDDTLAAMPDHAEALSLIETCVKKCTRCSMLANSRTQTVFGVGNPSPRLIFMGEAPGADEDLQGVPFVGRAGRLLTDMIEKGMKISRDQVYILNTLKCRPPGNRTPLPTEAIACREFLDAQLAVLRPEFICCLGAVAAQSLLGVSTPIGKMRGHWYTLGSSRVMCTWHPAYLLRNPPAKQQTWADLQMLMREMGLM